MGSMACIAWGGEFGGVRREGTMLYVVGLGKGGSPGGVLSHFHVAPPHTVLGLVCVTSRIW